MDKDSLRAILILSLDSVENPTFAATHRKICRWYSREFSTPLDKVLAMPELVVLHVYYEDMLQKLYDDYEGSEEAKKLYDETRQRIMEGELDESQETANEEADDEWLQQLNDQVRLESDPEEKQQVSSPNLLDKGGFEPDAQAADAIDDIFITGGDDALDFSEDDE